MAILEIIREPNELLLRQSEPVVQFDARLSQLLDNMRDTMAKARGLGLAAVQVGQLLRVCIVSTRDGIVEFINPEIIKSSKPKAGEEGCLSVPGESFHVRRAQTVTISAQDKHGKWFELELTGMDAVCIQHEIDHMNGILVGGLK